MKRPDLPFFRWCLIPAVGLLALASACLSTTEERRAHVLEYLYPEGKAAAPASTVRLTLPLTVGIAFVPGESPHDRAIEATVQQELLERVRQAFLGGEEIERIEIVPASFVSAAGGFENLRQIRRALGVDLVALLSYDQTQFDDPNLASITYWTVVGAYVIPGNENETLTLVDASVFDIESEALLFNAAGRSTVSGRTTAMDLERSLREDRVTGFRLAVDDMIPNLQAALERFRVQARSGTVRGASTPAVEIRSAASPAGGGATGAGALGPLGVGLGLLLWLGCGRRA